MIMKFFTKKIIGDLLKRIGGGVIKEIPIVGQISDNIKASSGGEGKIDWYKLIGSVIPIILLIWYLAGKLTTEQLEQLLKLF